MSIPCLGWFISKIDPWLNQFPSRNIVATVNLDCRLDLKTIALHARNAEYNPKVSSLRLSVIRVQCG